MIHKLTPLKPLVLSYLILSIPLTVWAKVIYVDSDLLAPDSRDGSSWENAYSSLHSALQNASAGDEIWLKEGRYECEDYPYSYWDTDRTITFTVPDGVSIYGGFDGTETQRSQADPSVNLTSIVGDLGTTKVYHVLTCGDNVTLDGLIIFSGQADGSAPHDKAGAIALTSSTNRITLNNCWIRDNFATNGGVTAGGNWTVSNCSFVDNTASNNGDVSHEGTWIVTDSTFEGNTASNGGVFYQANWNVDGCSFKSNFAFGPNGTIDWPDEVALRGAGGVAVSVNTTKKNTAIAENTLFQGNGADIAGVAGIFQVGVDPDTPGNNLDTLVLNIENCYFIDNYAFEAGVGYSATWNVIQSVFYDNDSVGWAGVAVGGIWTVDMCTFTKNGIGFSEPRDGKTAVVDPSGFARWTVRNSVFDDEYFVPHRNLRLSYADPNTTDRAKMLLSRIVYERNATDLQSHFNALVTDDPNTQEVESYFPQGTTFSDHVINDNTASPFLDVDDVLGPDGKLATLDDGLRLRENSPAEDQVHYMNLPWLTSGEPLLYDIIGNDRGLADFSNSQFPTIVADLGAYEGSAITITLNADTGYATTSPSGATNWVRYLQLDVSTAQDNTTSPMVFSEWNPSDASQVEIAYPNSTFTAVIPTQSLTLTAHYVPDTRDSDGDGLTNYDEIVVHGTSKVKADTSGDGIRDNIALSAGLDPTNAYTALVAEARRGLVDLRPGSTLITRDSEGKLNLSLQIERSTDLTNWSTDQADTVSKELNPNSDAEFYRFRMD